MDQPLLYTFMLAQIVHHAGMSVVWMRLLTVGLALLAPGLVVGEFKENECQAAVLDGSEQKTGPRRRGKQNPKKSRKENEPN
jgi:hypothetical protein